MTDAASRADAESAVFECDLEERPETVWRALTTPEIVAEWLGPNTMTQESAEPFEVMLPPEEGGAVACEILEASPPERLTYAWRVQDGQSSGAIDTEVTFTLTPNPQGGTHLRIEHSGLVLSCPAHRAAPVMASAWVMPSRRPLRRGARSVGSRVCPARVTAIDYRAGLRQAA